MANPAIDWGPVVADPEAPPSTSTQPTIKAVPPAPSSDKPAVDWGPIVDDPEAKPAPPPKPAVDPSYTKDQAELDAGVGSAEPIIPYGAFSKHMMQGAGKAVVGTVGALGDVLDANQKAAAKMGVPLADPETGVPYPGQDDVKMKPLAEQMRPGNVTNEPPGFMTSPAIFDALKSHGLDLNALPVTSGPDQIAEGAGGLLANLPMIVLGGGEAAAARGGGYLANIVKSAAAGGAGAAIETPGDMAERAKAAEVGALTGAGFGAVVPPVASVAGRLFGGKVAVPGYGDAPASVAARAGQELNTKLGPEGKAAIDAAAERDYSPGYSPTVTQVAPDNQGAYALEREARSKDPARALVSQRQQTEAELKAISTAAGTGNPGDVAPALATREMQIGENQQGNIDAAQTNLDTAKSALPPTPFKDQPAAQTGVSQPSVTASEAAGADTRAALLNGRKAAQDSRDALQAQINADGNVTIPTDAITANVKNRYALGPYDAQPKGDEADILSHLQALPANASLTDLNALRNRVTDTIDQLTPPDTRMADPARRLLSVKNSIDDAINNSAANATNGRPTSGLTGNQRWMSPEEASLHAQVKAKNQEIAQNYDSGAVGDILKSAGNTSNNFSSAAKDLVDSGVTRAGGSFSRGDGEVMKTLFDGSGNENANINQAIKAGVDPNKLKGWIARDMANTVIDPNTGQIDPVKYRLYRQQHNGLTATPDLVDAFDGLDQAGKTVQQAREDHAAALAQFRTQAVQHFYQGNPDQAVKSIFESPHPDIDLNLIQSGSNPSSSLPNTTHILEGIKNDPHAPPHLTADPEVEQAAREGLQKAAGDYIATKYDPMSITGTTDSDVAKAQAFNKFLTDHEAALKMIYGDKLAGLQQIGKQMTERVNVSPSVRARMAATNGGGHADVGNSVINAELWLHAAEMVPHGREMFGAGRLMMNLRNVLRASGIKTKGDLLNASAFNPTTTGKYLMEMQQGGGMSAGTIRRLTAAIGAAQGDQKR